jgi:hypothetical protein
VDHVLAFWTIYERPSDYPQGFVVRRSWVVRGHLNPLPELGPLQLYATLEEARASLPDDLTCLGRQPTDDPVIVESWV